MAGHCAEFSFSKLLRKLECIFLSRGQVDCFKLLNSSFDCGLFVETHSENSVREGLKEFC
jgi:hypothetical protein